MKKKALIVFLIIGAIAMIVMSAHYLLDDKSGILRKKEVAASLWYLIIFRAHVLFGLIAVSFGPFQFVTRMREKYKKIHRLFGYAYFVSVFVSSLCGMVVAPFAMGGWVTLVGFTILAFIWLLITIKSVLTIRNNDFHEHKRWSYLSYSLTFSAVTQRMLLLIPLLTNVPFIPIYQLSAWLPWVLNLMIAHSLFRGSTAIKNGMKYNALKKY